MKITKLFLGVAALMLGCAAATAQTTPQKPRVIVTCDPELDDNNSLIRYLLYATDFQTEGLIYASSRFHWKGDGKGTTQFIPGEEYDKGKLHLGPQTSWRWAPGERFIDNVVDAYAMCYPNLVANDKNHPAPEEIRSKVRWGNVEFQGDYSKDTPGSDLIKEKMLDDVPGKLFVQAWGGASTIARALKSIEDQYSTTKEWKTIQKKLADKVVLCLSGDQDGTYPNYIHKVYPDIPVQALSNFLPIAYNGQRMVKKEYAYYLQPEWVATHLKIGPFGSLQRVWGDGKQFVKGDPTDYFGFPGYTKERLEKMGYVVWTPVQKPGSFLAEGDTFCYLNLIDNGLRAWQDPTWAGWSGRKCDVKPKSTSGGFARFEPDTVLPNFFPEVMDGLAARFAWSVTPEYKDANHYPVVEGPEAITAKRGEKVTLNAMVSDPDGDKFTCKWWQFRVGTYPGVCAVDVPDSPTTTFTVPKDSKKGETIHLILALNDHGTPNLKRYLRTVITVK